MGLTFELLFAPPLKMLLQWTLHVRRLVVLSECFCGF
jgi:hypothetical protein